LSSKGEASPLLHFIDFDRSICSHLSIAETREWLVTNGIGGYAAGTVAGLPTRRYHGLLIVALDPPVNRTLLLTKLDETVEYHGKTYELSASRWADGTVEPGGFQYVERFFFEGSIPVWTFAIGGARLEKRIWMQPGENTTYIRYDFTQGKRPISLVLEAIVNHRDHHIETQDDPRKVAVGPIENGISITFQGSQPFYLFCQNAQIYPESEWYRGYFYRVEDYRGLPPEDDNLFAGLFCATLQPGESLTVVASTFPLHQILGGGGGRESEGDLEFRRARDAALLTQSPLRFAPPWIQQLVLAADQFIVRRALSDDSDGRSIIAGYPWFSDWGRDTMIALPGLTLTTGRFAEAAKILRTFAHYADHGMLPNRFPDQGGTAEYNTVDATLWYFEAIRAYHSATGDDDLLRELFPVLQSIIAWHKRGTRYQIHMNTADGLIYAGEPGMQLTWMDARVGDWVVTPRTGKPVEINALWYNALRVMADFAEWLGLPSAEYTEMADRVAQSFSRFWNEETGFCFDLIDGPEGNDPALRPNQLFAVSLPYSPLNTEQQSRVVDASERELLTPLGLRSLSAQHPHFAGRYGGDRHTRDAAYHQGTVWSWLIGPFVSAHLRVHGNPQKALGYLTPFADHLSQHGLGSISEIFDGDPPHTPRGCFAQAWGVAEVLRAWQQVWNAEGSMQKNQCGMLNADW
jgi:predicted glycogen debranching enzyme